ncbi:hypothetical protein J0910_02795 [Nocardiopsis sp. CNT-189]|uniref:MvdC/MvdD family ATP grasp protein n=1 Tax=Nocardiopsis oceanisediminis TaxID=2816862 RepID=UPI003B349B6E
MDGRVLVLADTGDGEARRVARALRERGREPAWLDLSWFPRRAEVSARLGPRGWEGRIGTPEGCIGLEEVGAVFYRHLAPFDPPASLSPPERRFAEVEARFGIGGVLASLPVRWVSRPSAVADAEYKPFQLAAAARAGFAVPATWTGNHPARAAAFVSGQPEGAVYKAIMHKAFSEEGAVKTVYTAPVEAEEIDERIAVTMHQLQQRVRGARDVRALVTAYGSEAVEIGYADGHPRLDYRAHYGALAYRRTRLDPGTERCCRRLLWTLGLRLGVFDLARTPEGRFLFYEVNPAGQWAWLEEETGAPMAGLVADELTLGRAPR